MANHRYRSSGRVLVVEDEAPVAQVLSVWLEEAGYDVCGIAADSRDALDLAMRHRPQLAVMDVKLSGDQDGVASARQLEHAVGTRSLFYTAHPEALGDRPSGLGHVVKPSAERDFLAAVEAAFALATETSPPDPPANLRLHGEPAQRPPSGAGEDVALRVAVKSAPHGIGVVGPDLTIHVANAALAQFSALDADGLRGTSLAALSWADTLLLNAVDACLSGRSETIPARDTVAVRTDGHVLYLAVSGALVRGADAAPLGVALHVRDITQQREAERAARYFGRFDHLTGLLTQDLLVERLERARARAARMGNAFAVLLVDLDRFREVNVAYGMDAADAVLVAVGDRIDDRRREVDSAARLGGDLFAVLLEGTTRNGAVKMAHDLQSEIRRPVDLGHGRRVAVSASIGVAWCGAPERPVADTLARAEDALDRAKHGVGGGVAEADV